ncbi:MAG: SNF2 helicase associated domain-containing protein, partial [Bacillota bacterium]|nr:SNF2 helicase associated domain-containing protein [Bacillota bacterium]
MRLNELKSILLKSASNAMKREGEDAFNKGLVTYFRGKRVDNTYHIYGIVKDEIKLRELNTHIKVNFQGKKLEGVECSCDEFKEFASSGYTLMCSHITATSYKFFSLLPKDKHETNKASERNPIEEDKKLESAYTARLIRKVEKDSVYYQGQKTLRGKRIILEPSELRPFLENIEHRKIKFKFDYIESTVPILSKDLPVTFNLKEDKEHIILTTHKQLPIPLNSNNDVYYFKNELYLPSKNQIERYSALYEKLKAHGKVVYRKDINNYIKLVYLLSSISENINIEESLRSFSSNSLKPEFFVFEDKNKIYCDVRLSCGSKKINLLNENKRTDKFIRDYKKEEKLLMKMEKNNFIKMKNRFIFTGGDEELFDLLRGNGNSIQSLGKVLLGKGLSDRRVFNSASIKADLYDMDGYYDFSYSIGDVGREELYNAFEAYKAKNTFYKTKSNGFIDFEDDGVSSFFNLFQVLDIGGNIECGKVEVEKSKALYLYENIKNTGVGFIKGSEELEEIENKLSNMNNRDIVLPDGFKGTLREYQIKGFKWLKTLSDVGFGGVLADEMGLGKTIQTIAFLLSEQNKKTFIVCPTSLIYNWKEEFQKFAPSLKVLIVHGSERIATIDSFSEYNVILTTYGTLRIDIEHYRDMIFDYCIIDEGQNIKNASTKNTKVIKEIKAKTRFALTGTPIENNLTELWSIFDFIMPGYLYSKEKFEEKFIAAGTDNLESLKLLIKPFTLRRTKKEVITELPDKIEKRLLVEMTASQKAIYSNYIKSVRNIIKNNMNGKIEVFSYLTKLRQICLDPSLIAEDYGGGSGKLEVAIKIIREHIDSGGKVLLFSQFTSVLDKISERLGKEEIEFFHLSGKTKPKDRIKRVNDFNSSQQVKVFLISLKAGGTGLN